MRTSRPGATVKVADEVWIATALLHREQPTRSDFSVAEIVKRAIAESATGSVRPGVYVHALQHAVANRPPDPGRYRLLFATAPDRRRLYRPGDPSDPRREGSKTLPERDDLPEKYRQLLDWYKRDYIGHAPGADADADAADPILSLIGLGRALWKDVDADEYVRQLREEWD